MEGIMRQKESDSWELFRLRCNVAIIASDPRTGRWLQRVQGHNLVVTAGKVLVARMMMEESGFDTGLTYAEIGTGTNAPAAADTALQTALRRKAISRTVRASNVVQFRTFFLASESNANLKECGIFGHSTATATIGTGELFARAAIAFDNSGASPVDLTLVWQITFG
jgi:hypothetical protein